MIKIETWLNPVEKINEPIRVAISKRFIDPETGKPAEWELTPIDAGRNEEIQKYCFENAGTTRGGQVKRVFNDIKYLNALAAATVTEPNLGDPDLQAAYGTTGSAADTLNKMLSIDEKNTLIKKIVEIYNADETVTREIIEDAKNE